MVVSWNFALSFGVPMLGGFQGAGLFSQVLSVQQVAGPVLGNESAFVEIEHGL